MALSSDMLRGHTDTIILALLLKGDSYGYEINKSISNATNGEFELKDATLYSAFRRLEQEKLIESYWGDEGVGARRRYYKITTLGKAYYEMNLQEWEKTKKVIDILIKGEYDHESAII